MKKIKISYEMGIEQIYKIVEDNNTIGFFMLERINDNYPYYLDYFGIFKKFQNKGYGSKALDILINRITNNNGLIAEIEKEDLNNPITIKRFRFYEKLGFKKIESEYVLYNVSYTPIINSVNKQFDKQKIDEMFFDYFKINCGEEGVKKYCRKIY